MSAKNLVKNYFLTDPELITGTRHLRWKRIAISGFVFSLVALILASTLGSASSYPDFKSYNSLSADEISKNGSQVFNGSTNSKNVVVQLNSRRPTGNIQSASAESGQVISRKDQARGEYILPAGSRIAVSLDGNLNSELSQSPVIAFVPSGFVFQGRTLVPAGAKILGRVGAGQESDRISVVFEQIVFPNGHQIAATGYAVMPDGSPGIVGEQHSGRGLKIAGAIGSSFLAGVAASLQTNQVNMLGLSQPKGSTRNAILNGVAQSTLEQGRRFSDEAGQSKGYVTVMSSTPFQVYFDREVDLSGATE